MPTSSTSTASRVKRPDAGGYLVIKQALAVDAAHHLGRQRALPRRPTGRSSTSRFYVAGDSAHRDKDGYFWIMGRIDDVLNVAGHRLGTMEIESALVAQPAGRRGRRRRQAARRSRASRYSPSWCCRGQRPTGDTQRARRRSCATGWRSSSVPIAKPDDIRFADNLPKTRSGKIMRRLLRVDRARRGDHAGRLDAGEPGDPRAAAR